MIEEQPTKHVLEGTELIQYLVEKASNATNEQLLRREERRNKRLSMIASILAVIGIGAVIGAIKLFVQQEIATAHKETAREIKEELNAGEEELLRDIGAQMAQMRKNMDARVDELVSEKLETEVGALQTQLNQYQVYQEFLAVADLINDEVQKDKNPEQHVATALKQLDVLANAENINTQPRFLEAAKVVIDLLVRTDRKSDIDKLEQSLYPGFVTDAKVSLDLADHYGQEIIASPYPPEKMNREFEVMSRYAQASRTLKYPEKGLFWELLVEYKRNNFSRSKPIDDMVEAVQDLGEIDKRNFSYHIFLNSHPLHWMNRPDQEGRALARLINKLMQDYPQLKAQVDVELTHPDDWPNFSEPVARKMRRLENLTPEEQEEVTKFEIWFPREEGAALGLPHEHTIAQRETSLIP